MIIKEIKYLQFSGKPINPISNRSFKITNRKGIILKITDDSGITGFGEASPLPEFSKETYKDVLKKIKKIQEMFSENRQLNVQEFIEMISPIPSLKFAFESALNEIKFRTENNQLNKAEIAINEVIGIASKNETYKIIENALSKGICRIKIKIGRPNFADDLKLITEIQKKYNSVILRLDANGAWDFTDAINNIEQINAKNIEYIEQPVNNLEELLKVSEISPIPVAADESISCYEDALKAIKHHSINFIIIKPSTIGFNDSKKIIEKAKMEKVSVVVSSLFESIVGKSANMFLASFCKPDIVHGLSPEVISDDFFSDSNFHIRNGKIVADIRFYPPSFNFQKKFH